MIQPCGLGCLARMGIRTFQFKICLFACSPQRAVAPEGASGLVARSSIWERYLRLVCWTLKQRVRRTPPVLRISTNCFHLVGNRVEHCVRGSHTCYQVTVQTSAKSNDAWFKPPNASFIFPLA